VRSKKYSNFVLSAFALTAAIFALACQQMQTQEPFKKFASDADVPRISVADAKKEVDAGTAIIVDSRAESAYKAEHITGSINVMNEGQFDRLPKGKKIIVYCS
jgi:hypothetical protein